jgi:two-component system NarL family sensor kinase
LTIAGLVSDRTELVGQLIDLEGRARRQVAEELHDGALQYVLAARQDLEDVRGGVSVESFARLDFALRETTSLLRAKVGQLHPAVLEQAGLLRALEDLIRTTAERSGTAIAFESVGWDEGRRTPVDDVLYSAARELLANVARHAEARTARVGLDVDGPMVRLTVADDGRGVAGGVLDTRLAEGHVGLASQRVRIEAAGGRFVLEPNPEGSGTLAVIEMPLATT